MSNYSDYKIDFQAIKRRYQQSSQNERLNILKHFALEGEVIGGDYVVRCPWRSDNGSGSFRIKLDTGCYHDFATGEHGDLIAFAAKCDNCRPYAAAEKLTNFMGGSSSLASFYSSSGSNYEPAKKEYQRSATSKSSKPDHTLFIWNHSTKREHPYYEKKDITPGNSRVNIHGDLNRIVAPMTDSIPEDEHVLNVKALHFIYEDGKKAFNLPMKGLFHIASEYDCDKGIVVICEGFATARSIAESVPGLYVISCMPACNMKTVALKIRELLPDSRIILAADVNENQVGQKAAEDSVQALDNHNVQIIYPTQGSDFNDMQNKLNKSEVRNLIVSLINLHKEKSI